MNKRFLAMISLFSISDLVAETKMPYTYILNQAKSFGVKAIAPTVYKGFETTKTFVENNPTKAVTAVGCVAGLYNAWRLHKDYQSIFLFLDNNRRQINNLYEQLLNRKFKINLRKDICEISVNELDRFARRNYSVKDDVEYHEKNFPSYLPILLEKNKKQLRTRLEKITTTEIDYQNTYERMPELRERLDLQRALIQNDLRLIENIELQKSHTYPTKSVGTSLVIAGLCAWLGLTN